jgi:alcohol dehydrogenase (cytochrome c)
MGRKLFLLLCLIVLGSGSGRGQVPSERIVKSSLEPQNWLVYSGNYAGWRYSALEQITPLNVSRLRAEWVLQSGSLGNFETTPLVVDGILYATGQDNRVFAVDARTGKAIWRYQRHLPEKLHPCCGTVNRGLAALGNRLFMATLDAHLIALDSKTGNVVWDVETDDYSKGYSYTLAPLAVNDKIVIGVSGGEFGARGFIDAYYAETGKHAWRFYTIPGPGDPGNETWEGDSWKTGGGPTWLTGSFDPELNLVYWGVGNPGPDTRGEVRKGDNLFTDCMVALDADTGKLKWYFQFTPHDVHDWDATEIPVLLDVNWEGQPRKLLIQANRNGFFYVLDRTNGQFLHANAFSHITWAKGIDAKGRPIVLPGSNPTPEGTLVCPGAGGGTNWMSPSYNPHTGLLYVACREQCDKFFTSPQAYRQGHLYIGSSWETIPDGKDWGGLRAFDPLTGTLKWDFKYTSAPWGGAMSVAGGVVFAGDMEGNLIALDARTGQHLWHFQTGSAIIASPIAYAVNGRQYVAIPSGSALFAFALPENEATGGIQQAAETAAKSSSGR